MIITVDGKVVRNNKQLRHLHPDVQRLVRTLQQRYRIQASGVLLGAANVGVFKAVLNIHTSVVAGATETVPDRAGTCVVEAWASGGGGHQGLGSGCGVDLGAGGGAGGYSRSSISVIGQAGKTFTYTIGTAGTGGNPNGGNGAQTTVVAGTVSGFSTITCGGGLGGTSTNGGPGGTGAGGNQANTTGGAGGPSGNGNGGTGITGTVSGDGSPYGGGGASALGNTHNGTAGSIGAVVFSYTA